MIYVLGGGGTSLSFDVVGGTSQPANPKENTIWVNSPNDVRAWYISPTEPTRASGNNDANAFAAGHIWIKTSESSAVTIDILRKNSIIVHPSSVYEYTDSGWTERGAQIYQRGAWADLKTTFYIYNNGNSTGYSLKCDEAMRYRTSGYAAEAERVTVGSSSITVATEGRVYDFANIFVTNSSGTFVALDLSNYTMIRIKGALTGATKETNCVFRVMSEMGTVCTENNVASQSFIAGTIDATIDVSSIDSSCYLGFTLYNEEQITKVIAFELTELWLE